MVSMSPTAIVIGTAVTAAHTSRAYISDGPVSPARRSSALTISAAPKRPNVEAAQTVNNTRTGHGDFDQDHHRAIRPIRDDVLTEVMLSGLGSRSVTIPPCPSAD